VTVIFGHACCAMAASSGISLHADI